MEIKIADEFTSTMQQLSAEAEKTLPVAAWEEGDASGAQFAQILQEFSALNGRLQSLEGTVAGRLEKREDEQTVLAEQFRKMDEHMVALRNTETVISDSSTLLHPS